jgi:hypothetical protein
MAVKGTTTSEDLHDEIKKVLQKLNIPIHKLVVVLTDGAPSMAGKNSGLSSLITKGVKNTRGRDLFVYYCLIHQESLCAKSVKMTNVVTVVAKLFIYIGSKGLNHRQFKQFLSDMDSENGDVLYFTEIGWLSRGRMLKRVYDLKLEMNLFLDMKGKSFPQLTDHYWMCDFAFCVDITQYLNELNSSLQGMNQLINEIFAKVKAFESMHRLWELQLRSNNMTNFPTPRTKKPTDTEKYAEEIQILQQEFSSRFQDFRKHEATFSLFSTPFDVSVETVPDEFHLEVIDLQCNEDLKSKFRDSTLLDFHKLYLPGDNFQCSETMHDR